MQATSPRVSGEHGDSELMLRVREGDAMSFALLVNRHRTSVIHVLYRLVQNTAVAEELAQEVFLRVYRARSSYEPTARFTTWLFRIATHLALNQIRDCKHEKSSESIDNQPGEYGLRQLRDRCLTAEQRMLRQCRSVEVRDAIELLPPKQRAAVLMHKYQDLEYSQIAVILRCSESAVKSLLFRAYATLRSRLAHMRN